MSEFLTEKSGGGGEVGKLFSFILCCTSRSAQTRVVVGKRPFDCTAWGLQLCPQHSEVVSTRGGGGEEEVEDCLVRYFVVVVIIFIPLNRSTACQSKVWWFRSGWRWNIEVKVGGGVSIRGIRTVLLLRVPHNRNCSKEIIWCSVYWVWLYVPMDSSDCSW